MNIRFSTIIADSIRAAINTCAVVFLVFCYYEIPFQTEIAGAYFSTFFAVIWLVTFGYAIANDRWFPLTVETKIVREESIGKAVIVEKTDASEYNKKVMSVHEAGHAMMSQLRDVENFEVHMSYPTPKVLTVYKYGNPNDVKSMIMVKYAGAIAEELVFGHFHAGCFGSYDSDFAQARELIKGYIVMTNPDVSKAMLEIEIAFEITELSKALYQEAKELLTNYKSAVVCIASELAEKDGMSRDEIIKLVTDIK